MTPKAIITWAEEKGILDDPNAIAQLDKTAEEVRELREEVMLVFLKSPAASHERIMIERGDIEVTLTILDHMMGLNREDCLKLAYDKIKNRKGKMVDGQFVKEEDL